MMRIPKDQLAIFESKKGEILMLSIHHLLEGNAG